MAGPRMTMTTQLVLRFLLEHRDHELYGLQIHEGIGLASGTVYPILARLEGVGWLRSQWEDVDPATAGRPRRKYYRLSPDGAERARRALATARTPIAGLLGRDEGVHESK